MTTKTNKLILRDDTSGYSVTRIPNTNLTANRTIIEQDRDGSPAMAQDIQDASVAKPSYKFIADNSYISTSVSAIDAFTNNDFTCLVVFSSDATTVNTDGLRSKIVAGPSYGYSIKYNTTGWFFTDLMSGASNTTYIPGLEASNLSNYAGKPTALVIQRHDNNGTNEYHTAYLNGVKVLNAVSKNAITYPTYDTSLVGAFWSSGQTLHGSLYRFVEFNYKISEDKARRYSAGAKIDWDDIGGSMTSPLSSGDSSTFTTAAADGGSYALWGCSGGATIGSAGGIGLFKIVVGGATRNIGFNITGSVPLIIGKTYRFSIQVRFASGNNQTIYIGSNFAGGVSATAQYAITATGTQQTFTGTFVAAGVDLQIGCIGAGVVTGNYEFDNIIVQQLGAVLDLEPENITDSTWFDASPNGLHGRVTNALAQRFTPSYSSRNWIINGGFDFWQRGTSFVAVDSAASYPYTADRWMARCVKQGTGYNGITTAFYNTSLPNNVLGALKFSITDTAVDNIYLGHRIESNNAAALAGKQCTFSFKIKRLSASVKAGTYLNVTAQYANSVDNFAAVTGIKTLKVVQDVSTLSDTLWTTISASFDLPTSVANGFEFILIFGAVIPPGNADIVSATGDFVAITAVQLNEGPVAAPFERAGGSIQGELAACQRYYEKSYNLGVPVPTNNSPQPASVWSSNRSDAGAVFDTHQFAVRKRYSLYTITIYDSVTSQSGNIYNAGNALLVTVGAPTKSENCFSITANSATNVLANALYQYHWTADAEL